MLAATADGKAIWNATVTSDAGWSHSFTLLKLAPALIWEHAERPALFAGSGGDQEALQEETVAQTQSLRR